MDDRLNPCGKGLVPRCLNLMYLKLPSLVAIVALGLADIARSAPAITKALPNLSANTVTISGTGFGTTKPTVTLSATP